MAAPALRLDDADDGRAGEQGEPETAQSLKVEPAPRPERHPHIVFPDEAEPRNGVGQIVR